jgi:small subunit ribosomal protein S19
MASKDFTYRGKKIEELKEMNLREFAKLAKSRTRRALLKQQAEIEKAIASFKEEASRNKPIRTHLRDLIIVPNMIGLNIMVHNGKQFLPIQITSEMLGHRLGEFALTRQKVKHGAAGIGATKSSLAKTSKKT